MSTMYSPVGDIATLKNLLEAQSKPTRDLAAALKKGSGTGPAGPALNYVNKVPLARLDQTLTVVGAVSQDRDGLNKAIQAVVAYLGDTEDLSLLDVLLEEAEDSKVTDAEKAEEAYAALVSARLQLKVGVQQLQAMGGGPPPPPPPPPTIFPAPAGPLQFKQFSAYLSEQQKVIESIRTGDADFPSESLLKTVVTSWQTVIAGQLPTESSDSDVAPPPGSSLPTRADLVDGYAQVDAQVTALIGKLDDILGDRNLLDPTIL